MVSRLFKETQRRDCLALTEAHQSTSTDRDHPRILITGGLGQLGTGLASMLRAKYDSGAKYVPARLKASLGRIMSDKMSDRVKH